MIEEWKDIEGHEGEYQVSNIGNVRSLNYRNLGYVNNLKLNEDKNGYMRVSILNHMYIVHRLVAIAFLENKMALLQINHKNECKSDNRVVNLEWVTSKQNANYGTRNKRMAVSKLNKNCKVLIQMDLQGNELNRWDSLSEMSRKLGYDKAFVARCCIGKCDTAYGYKWQYAA